jgi:hypothetical protein
MAFLCGRSPIPGLRVADSGVPDAAAQARFDDHRSYFTMVMDHRHALVPNLERSQAVDFMARDLATLFRRLATLDARRLRCAPRRLVGSSTSACGSRHTVASRSPCI